MRVALFVLVTAIAAYLSATRLRVSSDLSALFPSTSDAAALAEYTRVFGGFDLGVVLVRAEEASRADDAVRRLVTELRTKASIARVLERSPLAEPGLESRTLDPTLAWAYALPPARKKLEAALSPEGMRERLRETRALLLAPGAGGGELESWLTRDPLRLSALPWESGVTLAASVRGGADGAFRADEGRARLVLFEPRGGAFDTLAVHRVVADVKAAMAAASAPGVTFGLSGGHAIAEATERLLIRDLAVSGTASLLLAAIAFALLFPRPRALIAVLPPLLIGTVWTTGFASFLPGGLSAMAIAFCAVVVGVGVDTGVHVYASILEARRAGLTGPSAAAYARNHTWRQTLSAAVIAGGAFASLALSDLLAMKELGLLCALGEVLTAVAILAVTPEIGAWLERKAVVTPTSRAWVSWLRENSSSKRFSVIVLSMVAAAVVLVSVRGWPPVADAVVVLRPKALEPMAVQNEIYRLFGGRPGQWIVLTEGADEASTRERADRVAEELSVLEAGGDVDSFDSLTAMAPTESTMVRRLADRDRLDLPGHAARLTAALTEAGFDLESFAPALRAFAQPSREPKAADVARSGPLGWILARHLAQGRRGSSFVATFVRVHPSPAAEEHVLKAIHGADAASRVTGFSFLERALKTTLTSDLWKIGLAALGFVVFGLRVALRSSRESAVALVVLVGEVAAVGAVMRQFHIAWHVYDALVIPVLIGITIDEAMFLLFAARDQGAASAIEAQGPLVVATGLTTAAGFSALIFCQFEGLRDLGLVGLLGTLFGLVSALFVVPAGLTAWGRRPSP